MNIETTRNVQQDIFLQNIGAHYNDFCVIHIVYILSLLRHKTTTSLYVTSQFTIHMHVIVMIVLVFMTLKLQILAFFVYISQTTMLNLYFTFLCFFLFLFLLNAHVRIEEQFRRIGFNEFNSTLVNVFRAFKLSNVFILLFIYKSNALLCDNVYS